MGAVSEAEYAHLLWIPDIITMKWVKSVYDNIFFNDVYVPCAFLSLLPNFGSGSLL